MAFRGGSVLETASDLGFPLHLFFMIVGSDIV